VPGFKRGPITTREENYGSIRVGTCCRCLLLQRIRDPHTVSPDAAAELTRLLIEPGFNLDSSWRFLAGREVNDNVIRECSF
jgi:hypothetical protein